MPNELLSNEVVETIHQLGTARLVVGIPSFNNAETIQGVVETFAEGIQRYYPGIPSLIVNSDGGSSDGTREAFYSPSVPDTVDRISTSYRGRSGKGSALRTVFAIAQDLNAEACVVTDADCRTNDAKWVEQLIRPIVEGRCGFVAPLYLRDKHDATITNGLVYPLTRALYGRDIRQPIGGDFGISGGLLPVFTNPVQWEKYPEISTFGVDIWMTTTAIAEGIKMYQTSLGQKIHHAKEPGKDLLSMFRQVVGTSFELMKVYVPKWMHAAIGQPVPIFGEEPFGEIEDVQVNSTDMLDRFHDGYHRHRSLMSKVLSVESLAAIERVREKSFSAFVFPVDLWARVVYDFAVFYAGQSSGNEKEETLKAMIPLYLGRTASYVRELAIISDELADAFVRGCAHVFERLKPYLVERWNQNVKDSSPRR
jgi:glycosyltransferase involved in cell wall biosynthesis